MQILICISLSITLSTTTKGQIFLTKEGNATSALGKARKQLIRIAEINVDVFVPSNRDLSIGYILAQHDAIGKTKYLALCADSSLEREIYIRPEDQKELDWKDITNYAVAKCTIVQPFIFAGSEARAVNAADSAAAEVRLQNWLSSQPRSNPMFLRPIVETIQVISCGGNLYSEKIPKSAIPKLVFIPN